MRRSLISSTLQLEAGALTLYVPDRLWEPIPSIRDLFEDVSRVHEFLSHIGEIQFLPH